MRMFRFVSITLLVILLSSCSEVDGNGNEDISPSDNSTLDVQGEKITYTIKTVEFEVDIDNLSIEKIVVYENEGVMLDEMNEMPDNFVEVELNFELLEEDFRKIFEGLNGEMVCSGSFCQVYGPIPDIVITFTEGTHSFDFKIDNQGTKVYLRGGTSLMEDGFEFSFSNQYLLELTRIYDLIVDEYNK